MNEPDMLDVGARVLFKGRPGTIVDASPEMSPGPGFWVIVLDDGERVSPAEDNPHLEPWSPMAPSARMHAWRRLFARQVLDDFGAGRLDAPAAARVLDLVLP